MDSSESLDLDLKHYLLVWKRRWVVAVSVFVATVTLSVLSTSLMKPTYEAEGKLLFKEPAFKFTGSEDNGTGDLRSIVSTQNPINTQIEVFYSPIILQKTIDELNIKNKQGKQLKIGDFKNLLKIKIIAGTDLLSIKYTSGSPEEAARVVNKIMTNYIKNGIMTTHKEAEVSRQFIVDQIPQSQADVYKAQVNLQQFKQQNKVVNIVEESKSALAIVASLDQEITAVKAQLDEVTGQINAIRENLGLNSQEALAASTLSQSNAVQGVLKQLQDIEQQLAIEHSRFQDENPTIVNLEAKAADLRELLKKQIEQIVGSQTKVTPGLLQIGELKKKLIADFLQLEIQRFGLAQRLASLSNSRSYYAQRLQFIPWLQQNESELEGKLQVAQSTYQNLLRNAQELQFAANKNTFSARIIAEAVVPETPVSGKKVLVVALGVMLGVFFSTTTVFFLEITDKSLKSSK